MGSCVGKESKLDKKTKLINQQLEKDRIKSNLNLKILCLGAGESGKSTVMKQLKNIYEKNKQISNEEKKRYREVLNVNTIDSIQKLVEICEKLGIDTSSVGDDVVLVKGLNDNLLSKREAEAINRLWASECIQVAYENRTRFYIPDSTPYYFENIDRFSADNFLPSEEDIVMARVRTTGMLEIDFNIPPINFKFVDVGGQRSERKKWMRFFDDVQGILFIVNLSGYNTVLFEDDSQNRLKEALELFEEIFSNNYFDRIPVYIFFNKKDLFEQYLKKSSIKICFPEYDGPLTTMDQMEFIKDQFMSRVTSSNKIEGFNYIAARFKKDVKYAFEDVKDSLLRLHEKDIERALKIS